MRRSLTKPVIAVLCLGVALLLVGVTAYLAGGAASSGWFAYAPESDAVYAPGVTPVGRVQWWGLAAGGLGLLLLSGAAGYLLGRRRAASQGGGS